MKYRLIALIAFAFIGSAISAPVYPSKKLDSRNRVKVLKKYWSPERMTHPSQHQDYSFRYIINVIDGDLGSFGRGKVHYYANLLSLDPQSIKNNPRICSSYITANHRKMFPGQISLILRVPVVNFGPMSPRDIGSHAASSYSRAVRYFNELYASQKQLIFTPRQMLGSSWSEILLTGENESQYDENGEFERVKSTGAILRCLDWESIKPGLKSLNPNIKSKKIDLKQDEELAIQCLLGKEKMAEYEGKSLEQIHSELSLKNKKGQGMSVSEMRLLYLSNFYQYILEENSDFTIILFDNEN